VKKKHLGNYYYKMLVKNSAPLPEAGLKVQSSKLKVG